ncbi:MAG: hypothetical protein WDW36_008633 [Sanguina aurantia]
MMDISAAPSAVGVVHQLISLPEDLRGAPRVSLEDYVQARIRQFSKIFAGHLNPQAPPDVVEDAFSQALHALGSDTNKEVEGFCTRFRHKCRYLGCPQRDCFLCKNNPNKHCEENDNFDEAFADNQPLRSKCDADIWVELWNQDASGSEALPGVEIQVSIIDGEAYNDRHPDSSIHELLKSDDGYALLLCAGAGSSVDGDGRLIVQLQDGQAKLPDLCVTDKNDTFKLKGLTYSSFRMMARAVKRDLQGNPTPLHNIAPAISEKLIVKTQRALNDYRKSEFPHHLDELTKLKFVGSITAQRLRDIHALLGANVPFGCVETVEQLKQLMQYADKDRHVESKLMELLSMKGKHKHKWDYLRELLQEKVVYDDITPRVWFADELHTQGVLYSCKQAQLNLDKPVGLVRRVKQHSAGQVQLGGGVTQTRLVVSSGTALDQAQADVMRSWKLSAEAAWYTPGHRGWQAVQEQMDHVAADGTLISIMSGPDMMEEPAGAPAPASHRSSASSGSQQRSRRSSMILLAAQQAAAAASLAVTPSPPPALNPQQPPQQQHKWTEALAQQQQQLQQQHQQQQQQHQQQSLPPTLAQLQAARGSGSGGGVSNMFKIQIDTRKSNAEGFPGMYAPTSSAGGAAAGSGGGTKSSAVSAPTHTQMLVDHVRQALQQPDQQQQQHEQPGSLGQQQMSGNRSQLDAQQQQQVSGPGPNLAGGSSSMDYNPFIQGPLMSSRHPHQYQQQQQPNSSPQMRWDGDLMSMDPDSVFRTGSKPTGTSAGAHLNSQWPYGGQDGLPRPYERRSPELLPYGQLVMDSAAPSGPTDSPANSSQPPMRPVRYRRKSADTSAVRDGEADFSYRIDAASEEAAAAERLALRQQQQQPQQQRCNPGSCTNSGGYLVQPAGSGPSHGEMLDGSMHVKRPRAISGELLSNCEVFTSGPTHLGNGLLMPLGSAHQAPHYPLAAPYLKDESSSHNMLPPSSATASSGRPAALFQTDGCGRQQPRSCYAPQQPDLGLADMYAIDSEFDIYLASNMHNILAEEPSTHTAQTQHILQQRLQQQFQQQAYAQPPANNANFQEGLMQQAQAGGGYTALSGRSMFQQQSNSGPGIVGNSSLDRSGLSGQLEMALSLDDSYRQTMMLNANSGVQIQNLNGSSRTLHHSDSDSFKRMLSVIGQELRYPMAQPSNMGLSGDFDPDASLSGGLSPTAARDLRLGPP